MNGKVYKQYDSRWRNLAYPDSSSPLWSSGCGLCAVLNCIIEIPKYANYTPKDIYPFMKKYAVSGKGTCYANPDGIAEGLSKYGLKDVRKIDNMPDFWAEVAKGDRVGVILFWGGTASDGTVWTTGGHFVAFNLYQYKNGKHWLNMKDSGGRNNDGLFSYENSMRGLIGYLWTGRLPKSGWKKEGGYWYYYGANETPVKNGWAKDSKGKWFYLGADGRMVTSAWVKYKNEWYYLGKAGEMLTNGWAKDSKGWCYLGSDGKIVKSTWIRWKDKWYWLMDNGYMAEESWVRWKGAWYYLKKGGVMAAAETLVIQGKSYTFAENGKMK